MHNNIFVVLLFVAAAAIIGGAGFLVEAAICKNAKNKWIKFIPVLCLLCWLAYMIIRPVFIFYYMIAGFALLGAVAALLVDFLKNKKTA